MAVPRRLLLPPYLNADPMLRHRCARVPRWWLAEPDFRINVIDPEDREQLLTCYRAAGLDGGHHDFRHRARAADGRLAWLHDTVYVFRSGDGRAQRLRGFMVDITERRQAAEALRTCG